MLASRNGDAHSDGAHNDDAQSGGAYNCGAHNGDTHSGDAYNGDARNGARPTRIHIAPLRKVGLAFCSLLIQSPLRRSLPILIILN